MDSHESKTCSAARHLPFRESMLKYMTSTVQVEPI